MASNKKRRKSANQARKAKTGGTGGVHRDGDRRRRGGPSAKDAIANKESQRNFPGIPLDESH